MKQDEAKSGKGWPFPPAQGPVIPTREELARMERENREARRAQDAAERKQWGEALF